jgi:hypothetical protein
MIRNTVIALCCLAGMQNLSEPVVRFGEARYLLDTDWAGIREALGSTRVPWLINVSHGSQVGPFIWHANVYLMASVVRGDLRRGPLVDLEATYEGSRRVWRDQQLNGAWAQIALAPHGLPDVVVESDRARPFIVRGEFTDAELRAIVTALREWRPPAGEQQSAGLGPLAGLGRRSPTTAEARVGDHVFASLEIRNGGWVVASTKMVIE